ncbi:hypothetical protein CUMW_201990 [Citrus unshiu]|nr:hypothetical protein CUMW_201990 [Citrus unshiu]
MQKLRNTVNRQLSVEMGQSDAVEYVNINDQPSSPRVHGAKKVSILPLIFLIFYEVSGRLVFEDSVKAAGPLLALLGFLVFPIIWSVPEALITAEMGTVFPENCGYVVWIRDLWTRWLFFRYRLKCLESLVEMVHPGLPAMFQYGHVVAEMSSDSVHQLWDG